MIPDLSFIPKGLYIGGKWQDSASGEKFESINPSNRHHLYEVPLAGAKDVNKAVL